MGTRGFITFVVDGGEKTAYNHFDSYPDGLGVDVLTWLRAARDSVPALREQAKRLRVVDPESSPTPEDIERLRKYANPNVSTRELDEWYVLLRETQGNPHAMLDAGVIEDAANFPADSLFAEWGYVIDLDAETFEVYEGFQTKQHSKGRFADREFRKVTSASGSTCTYYPVKLVASWPFAELPSDDELLALEGDDE
jgi:hypothetical protein